MLDQINAVWSNLNPFTEEVCENCSSLWEPVSCLRFWWFDKQHWFRDSMMQAALIRVPKAAGKLFWASWLQIMQDWMSRFRFTELHIRAKVPWNNNCSARNFIILIANWKFQFVFFFTVEFLWKDKTVRWFYTAKNATLDTLYHCQRLLEQFPSVLNKLNLNENQCKSTGLHEKMFFISCNDS